MGNPFGSNNKTTKKKSTGTGTGTGTTPTTGTSTSQTRTTPQTSTPQKQPAQYRSIDNRTIMVNGRPVNGTDYLRSLINQNRARNMPSYNNATPISSTNATSIKPAWNDILGVRADVKIPNASQDPALARQQAMFPRMSLANQYPQMPKWSGTPVIRGGLMPTGPQPGQYQWSNVAGQMQYDINANLPGTWNQTPISATGVINDTLKLPIAPSELVGLTIGSLTKGMPAAGTKLKDARTQERERTDYTTDIELPEEPSLMPSYGGGGGGYPGGGGGGGYGGGQQQYPDWFERMYSWRF